MPYPFDFRIGTTAANKIVLPRLGIPWPDTYPYLPYARTETRGDGQLAALGKESFSWIFDTLAQNQLARFLRYFPSDLTPSVTVYVRTHIGDDNAVLETIDRKAIMIRPVDGSGRSIVPVPHYKRASWSNVTIAFTRLEE